jgi:hypothetical protein
MGITGGWKTLSMAESNKNCCLNHHIFSTYQWALDLCKYLGYENIHMHFMDCKVKQSLYMPWRRFGGEEL